jgi:hypothetical protein
MEFMMRILLGSKFGPHGVRPIGGVQTWVRTVAACLRQLGHEVVLFEGGEPRPPGRFDVGILANLNHTGHLAKKCKRVLQVSHGIIEEERPQFPHVAFTSEEVRDYWQGNGPVIRQPVDLTFWSPTKNGKALLTRFSYRTGLPMVQTIAASMGLVISDT